MTKHEPTLLIIKPEDEIPADRDTESQNGKAYKVSVNEMTTGQDKAMTEWHWQRMRAELNGLHEKLLGKPEYLKLGYQNDVNSILNAYREGDITLERATELLSIREYTLVTVELANKYVEVSIGKLILYFFNGQIVALKEPKEHLLISESLTIEECEKMANGRQYNRADTKHFNLELQQIIIRHNLL